MTIVLTRHARNKMRLYRISGQEIEEVISSGTRAPDPQGKGRMRASKEIVHRTINAVLVDEGERLIVITVFPG